MATVNQRLRENPGLQRMPKTDREWVQYQNELAKWVLKVASFGDGTITTSAGTQVDGLDEIPGSVHLGDGSIKTTGEVQIDGLAQMPGIVPSEQSLPMVNTGNLRSIQDTATPLTASDGGASATITIAAHGLDMSSGLVSYNGGSVTGLAYSTKYYVYALDPTYAGGAVTYLASTDYTDLVSNVGTYYVGQVITGAAETTGTISSIGIGSPTTFNMVAVHGFSSGWTVEIDNIVDDGPGGDMETAFNGNSYEITVTAPAAFTIAYDSSLLANTYVSSGTATRVVTYTPPLPGGGGGGIEP